MTRQQLIDKQSDYIERIQQGGRQLIPELWELLRPLTSAYINRYIFRNRGERLYDADDLMQESYLALLAALDYYQPEKGAFAAVYLWALQAATRATRGTVSRDAIFTATSLDEPLDYSGETEITLGDQLEDTTAGQSFEDAERREYFSELRRLFVEIDIQLTPEQRAVIRARYYDGLTLLQTGERLCLTLEQCRSAEGKALRVFRKPHNLKRLRLFDGGGSAGTGYSTFIEHQASSVELAAERNAIYLTNKA